MEFNKLLTSFVLPVVASIVTTYAAVWTFVDSAGAEGRPLTALIISVISVSFALVAVLTRIIINLRSKLAVASKQIKELQGKKSFCCVVPQDRPICPVGITRIVPHAQDTIRPSLLSAKRTFRWLGLSAFNVVHGNHDIFQNKPNVTFDFRILSRENFALQNEVNKYYGDIRGRMNAKKLIDESEKIIDRMRVDFNSKVEVYRYNQIPTFRIISIDDDLTFVSFYERGIDTLKTFQLELQHSEDVKYPIKNWFDAFLENTALTQNFIRPQTGTSP